MRKLIITIDGPAGAGKTTMAKLLAKKLGYLYLDTGAMYRAITLKAMRRGVELGNEGALAELARDSKIELKLRPRFRIFIDGENITEEIRSQEVTANVHYLARTLGVREAMWALQREIGEGGGVVAEGRDTGTVVFPRADIKFYLDAAAVERARRRQKDFKKLNRDVTIKKLKDEISIRDRRDRERKIAPLKKAKDAVRVDTTSLTIQQVLDEMLHIVNSFKKTLPG